MKVKPLKGLQVELRANESSDQLIKRFSRLVKDDGILREYRERSYYTKPSVALRRKQMRARSRKDRVVR